MQPVLPSSPKRIPEKLTNAFGLVDLEIGKGTPVTGTFTGINWGDNDYFLKVEMDPNGGSSWQAMGTSQLLSVPYALYATRCGKQRRRGC